MMGAPNLPVMARINARCARVGAACPCAFPHPMRRPSQSMLSAAERQPYRISAQPHRWYFAIVAEYPLELGYEL